MLPVETIRLSKQFGDFHALRECSITVEPGEVFGLLGPNGAGKTTWIRLLLGFIRPTSGSAIVGGIDVAADSVAVRKQVSYLPGDACLPRHMKAKQLLEFFASMHPHGDLARGVDVARRLELDLSRRVAFMSTGMRQKLALAVVLGPRTPLLILDEPTANLDPTVRGEVLVLVHEAKREGRTVIFSSHVLSEIEDVCDRAVFLRRGELVLSQPLQALKDRHLIRGRCATRIENIDDTKLASLRSSLQIEQDAEGWFRIDASGDLASVLSWLLEYSIERLRIEPVRLKTVYERVHRSSDLSEYQIQSAEETL